MPRPPLNGPRSNPGDSPITTSLQDSHPLHQSAYIATKSPEKLLETKRGEKKREETRGKEEWMVKQGSRAQPSTLHTLSPYMKRLQSHPCPATPLQKKQAIAPVPALKAALQNAPKASEQLAKQLICSIADPGTAQAGKTGGRAQRALACSKMTQRMALDLGELATIALAPPDSLPPSLMWRQMQLACSKLFCCGPSRIIAAFKKKMVDISRWVPSRENFLQKI